MQLYTTTVLDSSVWVHAEKNIPPPPFMVFNRKLNVCQTDGQDWSHYDEDDERKKQNSR